MNRRHREYEAPDLAAMLKRMSRALVRRAAEGDLEALSALADVERHFHDALTDAVNAARTPRGNGPGLEGYSWTEIGNALGVTRQTAQQRFSRAA